MITRRTLPIAVSVGTLPQDAEELRRALKKVQMRGGEGGDE